MQNVEAKFRLTAPERTSELALAIGFVVRSEFPQRDTFFVTASGKLKLREEPGGAHLIYYRRRPADTLQVSDYELVAVAEPGRMRSVLSEAFGVLAEVRKRRTLLIRGNVRLHLDAVEGLGDFGEIEAVLVEGESEDANRDRVSRVLDNLQVREEDLIGVSYFEMLIGR